MESKDVERFRAIKDFQLKWLDLGLDFYNGKKTWAMHEDSDTAETRSLPYTAGDAAIDVMIEIGAEANNHLLRRVLSTAIETYIDNYQHDQSQRVKAATRNNRRRGYHANN